MFSVETVGWFFTGVFLINAVPHLVHGVSGDRFPSPFARPHGKKLSSPVLNVAWAFCNVGAGAAVLYAVRGTFNELNVCVAIAGAFGMALFLAHYFRDKDKT